MGIGYGKGEKRVIEAVRNAVFSPLLETDIEGATGIIVNISGGEDMLLSEVTEACEIVKQVVDPSANIIFGTAFVPDKKDIEITIIATGLWTGTTLSRGRATFLLPATRRITSRPLPTRRQIPSATTTDVWNPQGRSTIPTYSQTDPLSTSDPRHLRRSPNLRHPFRNNPLLPRPWRLRRNPCPTAAFSPAASMSAMQDVRFPHSCVICAVTETDVKGVSS